MSEHMHHLIVGDDEFEVVDAAARTNINNMKTFVTPEMFGAVGDGVTDDTTAIQNAIDSIAGGIVCFLPEKTYLVSDSLIMHRGVILQGSTPYDDNGRGTVIKLANGANCPIIQTPMAQSSNANDATHYMIIEKLCFDGNAANQTSEVNIVEFYGAYIGCAIRDVRITNFFGSGLVLDHADVELNNIWILHGYSLEGRYAMDTNPLLAESERISMINANHLYIEHYSNKASGDPKTTAADRTNALRINKCASFNANEVHFEGCLTPITIDKTWCIVLNNVTVGLSGYDDTSKIIYVKSSPRLLLINGLSITTTSTYGYWLNTDVNTGNIIEPIPVSSGFFNLPFYLIQDSLVATSPVMQNPVFPNNATVAKYGSAGTTNLILKRSSTEDSRFRLNGTYTELGSSINQNGTFKPFFRIRSTGNAGDNMYLLEPTVLPTRTSAGSVVKGSFYIFSGTNGEAPVYQRIVGNNAGVNHMATVRIGTAAPTDNAEYMGEMFLDKTNKKLYVATALGTGSFDWTLL